MYFLLLILLVVVLRGGVVKFGGNDYGVGDDVNFYGKWLLMVVVMPTLEIRLVINFLLSQS